MATVTAVVLGMASWSTAQPQRDRPETSPTDASWLPWQGCWQLVEETGALRDRRDDRISFAHRVLVCVTPPEETESASNAVTITTIADGETALVETLRVDGRQQPVDEAECTGWRQASWSSDTTRLFTRAVLLCDRQTPRYLSGVGLMVTRSTWLDIELIETDERATVTIRRYRRAGDDTTLDVAGPVLSQEHLDRARAAATRASTTPLGIDDVIEASHHVEPAVLEALLVETDAWFELDGQALLDLDDRGVPGDVIDLMVALSFPEIFVIDRPVTESASSYGGGRFADTYGGYGYSGWYPYYASPFGYYYGWSPYSSLYYWGPAASYAIAPDPSVTSRGGRAYQGRGYTQVGARPPATRRAQPRSGGGGPQSVATGASNGRSGGSSGGGRATPGGYSRGGSSGRSAQPRDR
ncbi:MAG: hypothetical protein VYE68_01950 [Acidobacteriota bacterium]|nr:hypothetical protein [Acidobacteriota bacterium]